MSIDDGEFKKQSKNVLTNKQANMLKDFIRKNAKKLDEFGLGYWAKTASNDLGFKVTKYNFSNSCHRLNVFFKSQKIPPLKGGDETKRINRKLRTVARALLIVIERLDIPLIDSQIKSLKDAAEHH